MKITIHVGIIGFSVHEQEKFKHIFEVSQERSRCYLLKKLTFDELVDLIIVKTATESAFKKLAAYLAYHHIQIPVVTAGKLAVEGFENNIQGVLIVSRVLKVLNDIDITSQTLKIQSQLQRVADNDSVNVSGQYDILVVNDDEIMRKVLKDELTQSDIPLNIDFAINGELAIEKLKQKYYDFLFVDAQLHYFNKIDQCIRTITKEGVRASVVMLTSKESAAEEAHIVLRVLKAFSDVDDMSDYEYTHNTQAIGVSYNVLVIDDSELIHKMLRIELAKLAAPLHIEYALGGEEGLEKLALKYYDFIFLDVMMPGIDGFETCARIRKIKGMNKLPIIMLTSKTSPLDEVKGIIAGCTTYLTKPVKTDEFQKMLARIMRWLNDFKKED